MLAQRASNPALSGPSSPQLATLDITSIVRLTDKVEIFKKLYTFISQRTLVVEEDFYSLAKELANLRDAYRRKATIKSLKEFREILFLLQMVQEESLYVAYTHFNPSSEGKLIEKSWSWKPKSSRVDQDSMDEVLLRGIPLQNGDVLLSKASGAGSSSFIAMTGDAPHIFSHSTIAILTIINGELMLVSPEAEITDGVKLRKFEDYRQGTKTRLFVYRLQNVDETKRQQIKGATERFVQRMFEITPDPFTVAPFNYDFNLQPDTEGAYYCAAIPCRIYQDTQLKDEFNPYPRSMWGEPTEIRRAVYDFLELPHRPSAAPGDLESNRHYELVGSEILLHRLELERVELAILDSMFDLLSSKQEIVQNWIVKTDALGDKPITPEQIEFLIKTKVITREMAAKVPSQIKPKQMVFFGYLNEVFTPKIRKAVMAELLTKKAQGQIMGLQELRLKAFQEQESRLQEMVRGAEVFVERLSEARKAFQVAGTCKQAISESESPL
jgi:hypothetical protein